MKKLFCSLLLAAMMTSIGPVSASVIHVIFDVKVTGNSIDGAGLFGVAGGDLFGQSAIVDFSFNTATAQWLTPSSSAPNWLTNDPSAQVTTTVNGHSFTMFGVGGATDRYTSCNATFCNNSGQVVTGDRGQVQGESDGPIPTSLLTPYVLHANYLAGKNMRALFVYYGINGGVTELRMGNLIRDFPTDESLTISVTSGVPEPSTWAMMILGFAGVGFMAYRRKSKQELMAA
jgi:hypothetical protein